MAKRMASVEVQQVMDRIEAVRKGLGLGPAGFARGLGVERFIYQNHLPPKEVRPSVELLQRVVRYWGVDSTWLLMGGGKKWFLSEKARERANQKSHAIRFGNKAQREYGRTMCASAGELTGGEGKR